MVNVLIYFYAMQLWINILALQLDSDLVVLFILLPLLPAIPIVTWYLLDRHSRLLIARTQQLLRASAGPDELLVRELQKHNCDHSKSDTSG